MSELQKFIAFLLPFVIGILAVWFYSLHVPTLVQAERLAFVGIATVEIALPAAIVALLVVESIAERRSRGAH